MQGSTAVKAMIIVAIIICLSAFALMTFRSGGAALNWQIGADDPVTRFYYFDGSLYVISPSNVMLVNSSGGTIWKAPFPGIEYSMMGNHSELYVYSRDMGLVMFMPDGTQKKVTNAEITHAPAFGPDGTIYIRTWGRLTALNSTGAELWNITGLISNPVTDGSGSVYYFVRSAGHLSEVYLYGKSASGDEWDILFEKYYSNTDLMSAGKSGVYVYNDFAGELYNIDSEGIIRWNYYKPYLGQFRLIADEKGRLYLLYLRGTVHVLNQNGELISKFNHDVVSTSNMTYEPAIYNDTIYLLGPGEAEGTISASSVGMSGSTNWKIMLNSTGPAKAYADGNITCITTVIKRGSQTVPILYVIDDRGNLKFSYNSADGTQWKYVHIAYPAIYSRTDGGILYAFKG
jgi:hypothetical protein